MSVEYNQISQESLESYSYFLPEFLIAKSPKQKRSASRLLCLDENKGFLHQYVSDLPDLLKAGDVLVFNNTKVIKARLFAKRKTGAALELFFLRPLYDEFNWELLIKPAKRIFEGELIQLDDGIELKVLKKKSDGIFEACCNVSGYEVMNQKGFVPLPPYMKHSPEAASQFEDNYQSIFAKHQGAVAAPTASLHVDEPLKKILLEREIGIEELCLHVGYGTFKPLDEARFNEDTLHKERLFITHDTAARLSDYKAQGRRIIAVGTTMVRSLESLWDGTCFRSDLEETDLFIKPGYCFKAIDGLLTNFHLPKSSLMLLVSAFVGRERLKKAYDEAISNQYQFYSFGDAMLALR